VARGDNRPDSDLDILAELKPGSEGSVYDYLRFKKYVAGLFTVPVDVIDRAALKPYLRAPTTRVRRRPTRRKKASIAHLEKSHCRQPQNPCLAVNHGIETRVNLPADDSSKIKGFAVTLIRSAIPSYPRMK
jgi:hypothetical protein